MKNFLKFLVFVVLVSFGISLLYDYRIKHGGLVGPNATPEKYSLATAPPVDRKEIGTLEEFNRERRTLVSNILPSVVSVKTSKKIAARRQYGLDPFELRLDLVPADAGGVQEILDVVVEALGLVAHDACERAQPIVLSDRGRAAQNRCGAEDRG